MDNLSGNTSEPETKHILVVEDDESIRELLDFMLKKEGFQVELAVDGREAIASILKQRPDLVILDLMMPKVGGFDVLRELQKESVRVPIVVVTGRFADRSSQESIRQEANVIEFFPKPIKPAAFAYFLHRTLKTRPPELKRLEEQNRGSNPPAA